jgi:hypothetical protein
MESELTFRKNILFHLQRRKVRQARNQHGTGSKLHDGFLLSLLFNPKDGGNTFLQNVS